VVDSKRASQLWRHDAFDRPPELDRPRSQPSDESQVGWFPPTFSSDEEVLDIAISLAVSLRNSTERGERHRVDVAPHDRRVVEQDARRINRAVNESARVVEMGEVVTSPLRERHGKRSGISTTSGATGTLHVVRRRRRHITQKNRLDLADVDTEL